MEEMFVDSLCPDGDYKDALKALQTLQSNAAYLKAVRSRIVPQNPYKLEHVKKYLLRSGLTLERLDDLSVIHVAGTKGKGSTCAFAEAILRKHGFNTGFFSSPHLVTVRERIRINGQPVSQQYFARHFWNVFKKLEDAKEYENDMPTFFKFLTILTFNIFLDAEVDVAIIEVGIGGEKDCTNVLRNPVCVGITSLGLDHTFLLGDTLEQIAYEKSGIFKPNTVAFTVPQPLEAMRVLRERASERNCELRVVPELREYAWNEAIPVLETLSGVQQQNASLAIHLAAEWMTSRSTERSPFVARRNVNKNLTLREEVLEVVSLEKVATALSSCNWPGRTQILRSSVADFYLDGAHTLESVECCVDWYESATGRNKGKRILIFNVTGQRDSIKLLTCLKPLKFSRAYFVPNFAGIQNADDNANCAMLNEQKVKCKEHFDHWGSGGELANTVFEVLRKIKEECQRSRNHDVERPQVLVTGSLHLVGAVLTVLDPNLTMSTKY